MKDENKEQWQIGLVKSMLLEGGEEIRVKWKNEWWDAEYLGPHLTDSDLGLAILVMVIDDAPGLHRDENLVCVPCKEGGWKGLFPI